MFAKIIEHVNYFIHKASEWIVAGLSFLIYQLGIPLEIHALNINPYIASLLHGIVSMMVPVGSYFIIHISKELLKDPNSWLSITFSKSVYIASFKWIKKPLMKTKLLITIVIVGLLLIAVTCYIKIEYFI